MKRMYRLRAFYHGETMIRNWRHKIELICCVGIAANLLAIFGIDQQSPRAAHASHIYEPPVQRQTIQNVPPCQSVINQIVEIARQENSQTNLTSSQPLGGIDRCIAREERIDTSKCPSDFRDAESRFLDAERALGHDAHADSFSEPEAVRRAFFAVYCHRSPYDSLEKMSDTIKRDIDNFQSATFDLIQCSANNGVN